ncbi:hypothetical protein AGMMS49975_28870 [Clostridia bacterium]|nr:hypothetical protein AGMMS49975_28870 [Clostridia bacterium]
MRSCVLIRLLITGTDILNGRGIVTRRVAEQDFLMDIRNGRYSYQKIFALAEEYQAKFDEAAKSSKLTPEPDYSRIEKAQIEIFERFM